MQMEQITTHLARNGFERAMVNGEHVEVLIRKKDGDAYSLLLIDCGYYKDMPASDYENMLRGVRNSLYQYDFNEVHILSILCTDDPESVKEWIAGFGEHWVVDTRERRLLIYENQISSYLNAKELIEDSLQYETQEEAQSVENERWRRAFIKDNYCSLFLVLINCLVFGVLCIFGNTEDAGYILRMGGLSPQLIGQGIWEYRIFTSIFIHFNVTHLMNNMLMLIVVSGYLEKQMAKWRYVSIYLGSGIIGSIASLYYYIYTENLNVVCAGASGAIFGLTGALFWVILRNQGQVEGMTWKKIVFLILLNVYLGLVDSSVGNAAHIGGLIGGFVLAVFLYRAKDKEEAIS